ncbi:MAG TPA: nucleotide pyrophosphatase/phosphodiesterase family protein [Lacipirellulaceae bacterium]|nr:nucleotide pyrophosphatase/phosphodiesterase family protein [Lacipirellulaceae bacterium]
MPDHVVLLSIPGLRGKDVDAMPRLRALASQGDRAELVAGFPAVTCPVQANMTTGVTPAEHGVVANGTFHRERGSVEMWTEPNSCIARPQLWDILHDRAPGVTSAVWFPLHSKECGADYVCTPAPIHNPDGSESLWCYTKPASLYGELVAELGHFPLQHFWGPIANIKSTAWIVASAVRAASRFQPNLFYIYLPHLDYAAQKHGPDSAEAINALGELDAQIGVLVDGVAGAYGDAAPLWLVASEYAITPVDHVFYPNRVLRSAGLLKTHSGEAGEVIDYQASTAWAMADHQLSHVFIRGDVDAQDGVAALLRKQPGVAEVFAPSDAPHHDLAHPNSGELIVVSTPNSWQAYYWWTDDAMAPAFARTVDIHRKPGYDPVELFFDPATRGIPLDATLVKGSHGAPAVDPSQRGVLLSSQRGVFVEGPTADTDVADIVLRQFGI